MRILISVLLIVVSVTASKHYRHKYHHYTQKPHGHYISKFPGRPTPSVSPPAQSPTPLQPQISIQPSAPVQASNPVQQSTSILSAAPLGIIDYILKPTSATPSEKPSSSFSALKIPLMQGPLVQKGLHVLKSLIFSPRILGLLFSNSAVPSILANLIFGASNNKNTAYDQPQPEISFDLELPNLDPIEEEHALSALASFEDKIVNEKPIAIENIDASLLTLNQPICNCNKDVLQSVEAEKLVDVVETTANLQPVSEAVVVEAEMNLLENTPAQEVAATVDTNLLATVESVSIAEPEIVTESMANVGPAFIPELIDNEESVVEESEDIMEQINGIEFSENTESNSAEKVVIDSKINFIQSENEVIPISVEAPMININSHSVSESDVNLESVVAAESVVTVKPVLTTESEANLKPTINTPISLSTVELKPVVLSPSILHSKPISFQTSAGNSQSTIATSTVTTKPSFVSNYEVYENSVALPPSSAGERRTGVFYFVSNDDSDVSEKSLITERPIISTTSIKNFGNIPNFFENMNAVQSSVLIKPSVKTENGYANIPSFAEFEKHLDQDFNHDHYLGHINLSEDESIVDTAYDNIDE